MDKRTKRYFGLGVSIALTVLMLILMLNYAFNVSLLSIVELLLPGPDYFTTDVSPTSMPLLVLTGTVIGILVSYLMYHSFFRRDRDMVFSPQEEVILQRKHPEKAVILPQIMGRGDSSDNPPIEVNLYLTNMGVAAEPPGLGEPVLYIPFNDIQEMKTVNRMLLRYIKLRYVDITGVLSEILLYVGDDTDVWAENIGRMILSRI